MSVHNLDQNPRNTSHPRTVELSSSKRAAPLTCCASLYSMRALTAVVCVRRMFFWASSTFQSYLYLQERRREAHTCVRLLRDVRRCRTDASVPLRPVASLRVDPPDSLQVVLRELVGNSRVCKGEKLLGYALNTFNAGVLKGPLWNNLA